MKIINIISSKPKLLVLYILGFLFAFTSSIPAYVNSSFLESLTNAQLVGVIYSVGSILTLVTLILIPKILKKYGNYKVATVFAIAYLLNFLSLAFSSNIIFIIFSFLISGAIATIIYFSLDIFIEHNSSDIKTGRIRGIYLTCINLAWLVSPWLAGIIVDESFYRRIYFVVALMLIPVIFIILFNLRNFKDPEYKYVSVIDTIKSFNVNKNIKNIWISSYLLQFFFACMVVYLPIYLNQHIGFDWVTIGLMFSIALIPFVLVQIPLGCWADKKVGEKEILVAGFLIMAIFTFIIPYITNNNFIIWTAILFMTRVGAAMVEVMNDTYFFKNVEDKNINLINLYRTASPLSYTTAPLAVTILIYFIPLGSIFYLLGLLMFLGVKVCFSLKDTK